MIGSSEKFFYKDLAGISPATPGYSRITIRPQIVGDLTDVKASVATVRGPVSVDWKRGDQDFEMEVALPVNSRAEVGVPTLGLVNVVIQESGHTVWREGRYHAGVGGISGAVRMGEYVTFEVGSGSYAFRLSGTRRPSRD
ncbi:hypothetical protein MYX78_04040 [Acidobacteria bacterium AH-259-G07]|nr:hypothetical protein [Acidobacteria bacterium AH-259-G07]